MFIKQVSAFLENKSGKMAEVLNILGEASIDISALSIADTTDFGILRLIVNDPDKAKKVLREQGFIVKTNDILAVCVEDRPGGLAAVLNLIRENNIEIDYIYAFIGKGENCAFVAMKLSDPGKAESILSQNGIKTADLSDVYRI